MTTHYTPGIARLMLDEADPRPATVAESARELSYLLERVGWTPTELTRRVGVNHTTGRRWLPQQNGAEPVMVPIVVLRYLRRIARYLDANPAPRRKSRVHPSHASGEGQWIDPALETDETAQREMMGEAMRAAVPVLREAAKIADQLARLVPPAPPPAPLNMTTEK